MGLLSMLGLLLVAVLIPTMRASQRGSVRVEMQQLAVLALDKVLADLGRTPPDGVMQGPYAPDTASCFTLQALGQVTAEGDQVFDDHLVSYYWSAATQQLVRRTWAPGPGAPTDPLSVAAPIQLPPDQVQSIATGATGTVRVLSNGCTAFSLDTGPPPGIRQPATIRLVLARPPESYEVVRQVVLRNTN